MFKKPQLYYWINSILNSYSQIFFSLNSVLALIILLVTFIDPLLGTCGLLCIILSNIFAYILGLSKQAIREGIYGFNALLLGLALGFEYKFNLAFTLVLVSAVLILLFNTVWLSTVLAEYNLPFLGLPFLLTYWLVYLASGTFSFIDLQEQYIYTTNYEAKASLTPIYVWAHSLDGLQLPVIIKSYFKTLSSTFFQNSLLAGIIIAGGMLYFSRIAFTLSVLGFCSAFATFNLLGIDTVLLTDYLIGSNFIFMAIALGCFYVVPNKWSYLSVIILTPILCIMLIAFGKLLAVFQLKSFTVSFSLLTILFLFFLQHRWWHKFLKLVSLQYYSAEKTIYKYLSTTKRFQNSHLAKIAFPFWGEWKVSQGYDGSLTHLGDWSKALDFVIADEKSNTYKLPGTDCKDFYCYDKPVVAPYNGFVYDIINTVEENPINSVDSKNNWGNTIILNHQNGLFSQLSHIKKDSFKVIIGDYVTKGMVLATCGNSGRSPEPHLHFQLQLSPIIGEKTYPYPIAYYLQKINNETRLKTFEVPKEGDIISNVETADLLIKSYDLQPGKTIKFINKNKTEDRIEWKVLTDEWNRTYIQCSKTKSTLWFVNDGIMFYCYDFEGSKNSLLFDFYLANYKILLGCYANLIVTDSYPIIHFNNGITRFIQDFFAPFILFTKANYTSECVECDNPNSPKTIKYKTIAKANFLKFKLKERTFEMNFADSKLNSFCVKKNTTQTYICEVV